MIEKTPMEKTWESASFSAMSRIFDNVRNKPRADIDQLRADLEGFIDEHFHATAGFEKAKVAWAIIGADALELAIKRGEPFTLSEVHTILVGKQRDYGSENIRRFGRQGLMVRMHDKVARLENLLNSDGGGKPTNESIRDNLMDVVGYSTIGIMWESMTFLYPMESPASPNS